MLAAASAAWYGSRAGWFGATGSSAGAGGGIVVAEALAAAGLAWLLFAALTTYAAYRVHRYFFTEEAFMMTSGIATRNEVAALYHQIQNVNITRSPADRIWGVSQIVIFMTGSDREAGHTRIVLPALSKSKAKLVQGELLSRARRHVARPQAEA